LFKNPASCTKWIIIIHIGFVFVERMSELILRLLAMKTPSLNDVADAIKYTTFTLVPACSMLSGINTILTLDPDLSLSEAFAYSNHELRDDMLLSVGCMVLYIILALFLELFATRLKASPDNALSPPLQEDPDVTAERTRIESGGVRKAMSENAVVIHRVRKVFQKKFPKKTRPVVAVNNVSFGIHENDCFGLLGPNGAGKSTLINMMTAELCATNGTVSVNGTRVVGWKHSVYPYMALGRCLQTDALMDFLTAEQTITIMCGLRCDSTKRSIKDDTEFALRNLELTSYANRPVSALSGGMRRKLSTAIAMLPGARLLVFDEPSTGMDPITRRALWSAIARARSAAGRSVLLTTHSMEEAETLCGTLGIVTRGTLQCFGNVQHLKDRYSNGYRVMFEYDGQADITACEGMLANIIRENSETPASPQGSIITCVDINANRRTYAIPPPKSLSRLFTELEKEYHNHHIISYAISQATLDDVFMTLVRAHEAAESVVQP